MIPLLLAVAGLFDYTASAPLDIKPGIEVRNISYAGVNGRVGAYLVRGATPGKHAGILFVHWYDPASADSNRGQFLTQAVDLAQKGATSLLIDTMWSDPAWFPKRDRSKDYANSIAQVKELRRALDLLLAQKDVDPSRVAYVGHDFGMMYGAVLAGADSRVKVWALQAGTGHFPDWFLYGPKMEEPARTQFVEQFKDIDPVVFIGKAQPLLLQFGTKDFYVPDAKRDEIVKAAPGARVLLYEAGHGLNEKAIADRQAWLREQLGLK